MNSLRDAPAFDPERNDYPLSGEKVGPIWRAAWRLLRDLGEHSIRNVIEHVQSEIPDANPETVRQIMRRAVRAGVITSRIGTGKDGRGTSRPMAFFRIER